MTALHRKLYRDLWLLRGPVLAIGLVMASGVATFVMSLCTLSTLYRTQSAYYERNRFADAFVRVKRAPEQLTLRLRELPGVDHVETRITQFVILDLPQMAEPATGRLMSIPDRGPPVLNRLHLQAGRWPELERPEEVLVSDGFARAHRLQPGDRIGAILNGKREQLRMVGIALSPEFIYQIREGDILPDDRRFGIFWMRRRALEAAFRMEGAFNDAAVALAPQADLSETVRAMDRLTAAYGGTGAFSRDEQSSHKFVSNEMNELRGMALVIPSIFLLVAAWLLQVVVSRLIRTQREQIATLRAFGYTVAEIGAHYLQLVLVMAWLGALLGVGVGAWLGRGVASMYSRFFHFPTLEFQLDGRVIVAAFGVSTLSAIAAVAYPIWRTLRLPPAIAMRPEVPPVFGTLWFERRMGLSRMPIDLRMTVRQILRRPVQTTITCLGIALAVSILILGRFLLDGLNYAIESEFHVAQRQDLMVTFVEPANGRVESDVAHLPGVLSTEPFRAVSVRLRAGPRSRRMGLIGLPPDSRLWRVADVHRQIHGLPREGLILSSRLAKVLAIPVGGLVDVEVLEGRRPIRALRVVGVVEDFQGEAAYASLEQIHRLLQEGDAVTGVLVAVDARRRDELYRELKRTPQIMGATFKGSALESLRETIVSNILRMRAFNVGFACIIACGVVYNSARITLAERSRELAMLRVLGFSRAEVARMLLGELAAETLVAIPLGIALGHGLADFVIRIAYDTELFRIPLVIARSTDAFAALVTLVAALGTGWLVARQLARLDLVAVLKARE